jgi:hypothetical protein
VTKKARQARRIKFAVQPTAVKRPARVVILYLRSAARSRLRNNRPNSADGYEVAQLVEARVRFPMGSLGFFIELNQWFPNFFGPPPPWFHIQTHSAPLPLKKKHKCAFISTFILYSKKSLK